MSGHRFRRRRWLHPVCVIAVGAALGGCSAVPDAVNPMEWYKGARDLISGDDRAKARDRALAKAPPVPGADQPFPKLSSVPEKPRVSSAEERRRMADSLIADRENARYMDTDLRRRTKELAAATPAAIAPPSVRHEEAPSGPRADEKIAAGETSPVEMLLAEPPVAETSLVKATMAEAPKAEATKAEAAKSAREIAAAARPALPPPPPRVSRPEGSVPSPSQVAAVAPPPVASPPPPFAAVPPPVASLTSPSARPAPPPAPSRGGRLSFGPPPGDIVIVRDTVLNGHAPQAGPGSRRGPPVFGPPPSDIAASIALPAAAVSGAMGPAAINGTGQVGVVYFRSGSARLNAASRRTLAGVARAYRENGTALRVVGFASSRTLDMNLAQHNLVNFNLSLDRANSVAAELMRRGVAPEALFLGAESDFRPRYFEVMPVGEAGNRRVEIYLDSRG